MRVAVCLSGQARNVNSSVTGIINDVIISLNADVFCHFWDTSGNILQPEQAIREINPTRYRLEKQIDFPDNPHSMFYSILQSNNLKKEFETENDIVYDCVVRCRTDIKFERPVTLDEYVDDGSLWVYKTAQFGQGMACADNFAFSSSKIMDTYSKCFNHIGKYPKVPPECILYNYLKDSGIDIKLTKNAYEPIIGRHP